MAAAKERDVVLGHGEGSVFADKSGRIRAERSIEGKRRTFYEDERGKRFDSEKAARVFLRRLSEQLDAGARIQDGSQTLGTFMDAWLDDVVQLTLAPNTYRGYKTQRNTSLKGLEGVRIERLTSQKIQEHFATLARRNPPLAPSTIALARRVLRAALTHAVTQRVLSHNPAAGRQITTPRVPKRDTQFLKPEEIERLLQSARGDSCEAGFFVALGLGLRISETSRLCWAHFDFERRVLDVPGSKSERSSALLHFPVEIAGPVRRCKAAQAEFLIANGVHQTDETHVCLTEFGDVASVETIRRHFKMTLKKAGLGDLRFHDLRHSCGSLLMHLGVPIQVVKEIMRHSKISTTVDTYGHLMPGATEAAMERMGELFRGL